MRFEIDYSPTAAEQRKAIDKAYTAAVRAKYNLLVEHELRKGREKIEEEIATATAEKRPIDITMAQVFAMYGPESLSTKAIEKADDA